MANHMPPTITVFQKKVYDATRKIPKGHVTTYKLLGDFIACSCYRAIGQALRRNPFAPEVPCHRVIASDLSIGGFSGKTSGRNIARKLNMLSREGVDFCRGRLRKEEQLFRFSSAGMRNVRKTCGKVVVAKRGV
jgi:methylated-DNA-[protein]-cysteine S-methyltransferase